MRSRARRHGLVLVQVAVGEFGPFGSARRPRRAQDDGGLVIASVDRVRYRGLVFDQFGNLYAGGAFTSADGNLANRVAEMRHRNDQAVAEHVGRRCPEPQLVDLIELFVSQTDPSSGGTLLAIELPGAYQRWTRFESHSFCVST